MRVFRVASEAHPEFDGIGASKYPGRWNHAGTPMVYTSENLAVAMIETLANSIRLPERHVWIEAEIPSAVPVEEVDPFGLPPAWGSGKPIDATRDIGTEWVKSLRSPVLKVPCAMVPGSFNYLINPLHPDAVKIVVLRPRPLSFDRRLK